MSNSYFDWPSSLNRFVAFDTVRSVDANNTFDLVSAGFALLPTPVKLASGTSNYAAVGGSADAYTFTMSSQVIAYTDGLTLRANFTSALKNATTTPVINVNGLGNKSIVNQDGTALTVGDLIGTVDLVYNTTAGKFLFASGGVASRAAAAASATAAASSATSAASSASSASSSATAASGSATSASGSASAASTSESNASTSASSASTSATAAASSASSASTSASTASTAATNASSSASSASTSATNAASSASAASTSASAAAASATAAAASATTAAGYAAALSGTSTTSLAIATGSKSFTASTGKQWTAGQFLIAASNANAANYMNGQVTSYNSGTGALVLNVTNVGGSGTLADWNISISGAQGAAGTLSGTASGAINWNGTVTIASASTVNIGAAVSNDLIISGTTTITAFDTIAAGAMRKVKFTGALTLTHNATSLILPGSANITTANGDTAQFTSLGSGNWKCDFYQKADGTPVVAAASGLTLIASGAPSSVATLEITSGIDSTYDEHQIHLINFICDTNGQNFLLRTSADNGGTWDSGAGAYCHALLTLDASYAVSTQGSASQTSIKLNLSATSSTTNDGGISGVLTLWRPSSSANYFNIEFHGTQAISGGTVVPIHCVGSRLSAAAVNGIQLRYGSGNIASGYYKHYGVKKS